ncbi:MAG: anti-sigma factor family protein [Gemmatimonadaceae bacterium]
MGDCANATMRERLPDLLHNRLPASERAEVDAHLDTCADCRAELALLERVRSASRTPTVDAAAIAARLPAYRPTPGWTRVLSSPLFAIAAGLVLVAGVALMVADRVPVEEPAARSRVARSPADSVPVETRDTTGAPPQRRPRAVEPAPTELAVGAMFDDLTDAELETLLRALGSLETLTPVETEVVVPAVNRSGAG